MNVLGLVSDRSDAAPRDPSGVIPQVPILKGWNVWDVYQSQAPIDGTPGTPDEQLKAWITAAVDPTVDLQPSVVSNNAAGDLIATRSNFPELAGPLHLGAGGSTVFKRTIAFHNPGERDLRPWPADENTILDAAYLPAPAPAGDSSGASSGAARGPSSSGGPLMLALGAGMTAILLLRGRRRR